MKRYWALLVGIVMVIAGSLLVWQDIGSPNTSNIVQGIGLVLIIWNLLRWGGG